MGAKDGENQADAWWWTAVGAAVAAGGAVCIAAAVAAARRAADAEKELCRVRSVNQKLNRVIQLTPKHDSHREGGSELTPAEIETLRAVFSFYDAEGRGVLTLQDIALVHSKLGEPLTEEELAQAMAELDRKGTGQVTFDQFRDWWVKSHQDSKDPDKYRARFKMVDAKLQDTTFDLNKLQTQQIGQVGSRRFRVKFYYKNQRGTLKQISPWHDIPLRLGYGHEGQFYHFICEIPKWTRRKYEIATGEPYNPIKQDVKNGQLRIYQYGDALFNYGCLPQTWEDPKHIPEDTGCPGDNDPIDAFELGTRQMTVGQVAPVKVLGTLALIDGGETDWKLLTIQITDPLAHILDDIDDVRVHMPGAIEAIREYLRVYKVCTGQPENTFALDEEALPQAYAKQIIERTHENWKNLRKGGGGDTL